MAARMHRWFAVIALVLSGSTAVASTGGNRSGGGNIIPHLARLKMYVAEWRVMEHHFNARGEETSTVKGTETTVWILGKRAIQRTYVSGNDSPYFRAIGTLTWNGVEKKYHGVWFDNASTTGPTVAKGEWHEGDRTMIYTLDSLAEDGSTLRHKVVERFFDDDRRIATTYLIKGAELVKRLEVEYKRTIPCPGRRMRVLDEINP